MRYEEIPEFNAGEVAVMLARGEPADLRLLAVSVGLHSADAAAAEAICLRLASHPDGGVRGNAILGLGHIARIHRQLSRETVQPLVEAALRDPDKSVRGQAVSAAGDIEQFLGWMLDRP